MTRLFVLSVVLAGCAAPKGEPVYLPVSGPRGPEAPAPASRSFAGLTLEQALELAEREHPQVAEAKSRVTAAEGRMLQAGLWPNPEFVAKVESAPFQGSVLGDAEYLAGASIRLPVGGRLEAAVRVEELEAKRAARDLEVRRREVRGRVHAGFAAALFAEQAVRLQEEALRIAENGAALTRARLGAGDALPEDVARAEVEGVRVRLERDRAASLRSLAGLALAAALGDSTIRVESVAGALDAALDLPALGSILSELDENALMSAVKLEIEAAESRVDLARAQRVPDVNLDLFYRRLGTAESNAFDVGVSVPLPLFDRNQGRLAEARAEVSAARARAQGTRSDLERQVREAHARLSRSLAQAKVVKEEILPRFDLVLKGAEARHAGGDLSLADILPIRRERTVAGLAYLEGLREVMEAWAVLSPYLRKR